MRLTPKERAELRYRAAVLYCADTDDIEIDDNADVLETPEGGDDGNWVAAWLWVPKQARA